MVRESCVNQWCDRPRVAFGYCHTCYMRAWSSGDPDRAKTVSRAWELSRADVDPVSVERLVSGDHPATTSLGEREAAVRYLHELRLNDRQIADRLHRTVQFVQRTRKRLGLPANQTGPSRRSEVYFTDHLARSRAKRLASD